MMTTMTVKKLKMTTSYAHLPLDILFFDILSRLPIKSLLRFSCVSKQWYTTIRNPEFIRSHMILAKEEGRSSIAGLFQVKRGSKQGCHDYIFVHQQVPGYFRIQTTKWTCIVGDSNGLLCIHSRSGFEICNPITREFLYHPFPSSPRGSCLIWCGFGFDPLENEYKVVQIVLGNGNRHRCVVYTLGANNQNSCWKDITVASNISNCLNHDSLRGAGGLEGVKNPDRALYSNGALHWFFHGAHMILSFDIHDEKFCLIKAPHVPPEFFVDSTRGVLTEWKGCMCLAYLGLGKFCVYLFKYELEKQHHNDHLQLQETDWPVSQVKLPFGFMRPKFRIGVLGGELSSLYWFADGRLTLYAPERDHTAINLVYSSGLETQVRFSLPLGLVVDNSEYEFSQHRVNLLSLKTLVLPNQVKSVSSL